MEKVRRKQLEELRLSQEKQADDARMAREKQLEEQRLAREKQGEETRLTREKQLVDTRPKPMQPVAIAALPYFAIGLEHFAQHAVQGGICWSTDGSVPELRQVKRQDCAMRDVAFRSLRMFEVSLAHRPLELREQFRDRHLVIPNVGAIERARTAKRRVPHSSGGAKTTFETEEFPVRGLETGWTADEAPLSCECFDQPAWERAFAQQICPSP